MALSKSIPQPTGVAATYHRIVRGSLDFATGWTTLDVASYVDKAARDANKLAISNSVTVIEAMPPFNGDPRDWAYSQLKAVGGWTDAVDA